jgi:hypothetical protein
MEDWDSKENELKGLENEIDQAIDSLFVDKANEKEGTPSKTAGMSVSGPVKTPEAERESAEMGQKIPSQEPETGGSPIGLEVSPKQTDGPLRNLENLETHLLSLEWEISPDLIQKISSELGFLKEAHGNDPPIFNVIEVMGKVANALGDDQGNITPESLRFLLDAKDGIKLLRDELRDQAAYKNMVASGILARYRLMQDQRVTPTEERTDFHEERELEELKSDLKELSQQLRDRIRQLGSITQKLQSTPSAPPEMVRTVLVESSGRVFAIERDRVLRSIQIPHPVVRKVWRDGEIRIRGDRLPLVNLLRVFKLTDNLEGKQKAVVLIERGNGRLAILVDRLLQKREIPSTCIREEKNLAYIRGIARIGRGLNIYFLDTDRLMAEF